MKNEKPLMIIIGTEHAACTNPIILTDRMILLSIIIGTFGLNYKQSDNFQYIFFVFKH